MQEIYSILRKPIITEKTTLVNEEDNKVTFEVDMRANKAEIKAAVEELFGVRVLNVNTARYKGKRKRFRNQMGKQRDWKKAVVTLQEGDRIEFFEGA
jgi:large subunit ribosomal protein L23